MPILVFSALFTTAKFRAGERATITRRAIIIIKGTGVSPWILQKWLPWIVGLTFWCRNFEVVLICRLFVQLGILVERRRHDLFIGRGSIASSVISELDLIFFQHKPWELGLSDLWQHWILLVLDHLSYRTFLSVGHLEIFAKRAELLIRKTFEFFNATVRRIRARNVWGLQIRWEL